MRIKIEPYYDNQGSSENPFWYKAWIGDKPYVACGPDWTQARARLIEKLITANLHPEPPLPEEIEL
jgi:hypothetical protein